MVNKLLKTLKNNPQVNWIVGKDKNKNIGIVNVRYPIILINPTIISARDFLLAPVNDLDYPGKIEFIPRFRRVSVKSDLLSKPVFRDGSFDLDDPLTQESIAIQNVVDKLQNNSIFFRKILQENFLVYKKLIKFKHISLIDDSGNTIRVLNKKSHKHIFNGFKIKL